MQIQKEFHPTVNSTGSNKSTKEDDGGCNITNFKVNPFKKKNHRYFSRNFVFLRGDSLETQSSYEFLEAPQYRNYKIFA